MTSDWLLSSYRASLRNFRKHPSVYAALSVFLAARKCGEPIPEEVLKTITPLIEKLFSDQQKQISEQQKRKSKKRDDNELLLQCVLEKDDIEKGCERFKEKVGQSIPIATLRKRLERFLAARIKTYMNHNISDPAIVSKHFPFKATNTEKMLDIYRDIKDLENS